MGVRLRLTHRSLEAGGTVFPPLTFQRDGSQVLETDIPGHKAGKLGYSAFTSICMYFKETAKELTTASFLQ